ncbi:MAG: AAA family ATPase [Cyanobium sp.]
MAESNRQDVHVPWFSGLCLQGEVAGQYEIERSGSQQELEEAANPRLLELDGLAPITIFVGANNSGKSRIMRELFKTPRTIRLKLKSRDSEGVEVDIRSEISNLIKTMGVQDNALLNGWIVEQERSLLGGYIGTLDNVTAGANVDDREILLALKPRFLSFGIKAEIRCLHAAKRCYVPILRGLRPPFFQFKKGDEDDDRYTDLYASRTARDYFQGASWTLTRMRSGPRNLIFTGLSLYDDLRRRLLGRTQAERDSVRVYENFFSENFFPGQSVILIPVMEGNNDVVHIKIGENKEYPIYDLGDGMQSLIICTYPIVTETEPGSLFFLEEPDLCMHPSLQRTFLEVLKTYHRKMGHQFLITTHSNHLLDLLEDNALVSIFSFSEIADRAPAPTDQSQADSGSNPQQSKPKPSFRIRPSNLKDRQTLVELGVRPSATYLANATVWVEGVSDGAYLRAYMQAFVHYLKHLGNGWGKALAERLEQYKEDRHYAFVKYSVANLKHFSFEDGVCDSGQAEGSSNRLTSVPDLCARSIVVADGDIGDTGKGNRKESFAAQLGDRFILLPGKEIENMIPEALMRDQVRRDNPKIETTSPGLVDGISYENYYRAENGVGAYLSSLGFVKPKYDENGLSGTLSSHMKGKWASNDKGIPWLVRQELKRDNKAERDRDVIGGPPNPGKLQSIGEAKASMDLPSYLTQDLIWLCVCLYAHIANCNHDQETEQKLRDFQRFIKDQEKPSTGHIGDSNDDKQPCVESDMLAESAVSEWPIKDVERKCLLTAFLDRMSKSEAISSPHQEPQAQATSTVMGPTASPAPLPT